MVGEWRLVPLSELADLSGGFAFKSKDYTDSGRFILRTLNIHNDGSISRDDAVFLPLEMCNEYSRFTLQACDTLFVMVGATLGKVGFVRESDLPALLNQNMWLIRAKPGVSAPRFIHYAFRGAVKQNLGWASGSARDFVRRDDYRNLLIAAPGLKEQQAIACILGALDDKIELNRRMNKTLEGMARAIFKSWFVDFDPVRAKAAGQQPAGLKPEIAALFPDAFEDSELGEIPKGWRVQKLGDVLELAYGKALKANNRREGAIPVYGSNGQVGWHDEKLVSGPGIVVGRKGNPGVVTWSSTDFFAIDTTFYVVHKSDVDSLHFLFFALQTHDLPSLGADSAVPGLNRNIAYMSKQVVPPNQLIEQFEKHGCRLFARSYQCEEESRTLAAVRDTLLPKLLSGEVRVRDAERIVGRCA